FGPGKALGGDLTGVGAKLLEGWSLGGILSLTTGAPFSATISFDYAAAQPQGGGGGQKPDLAPNGDLNPVIDGYRSDPAHYFDPLAFDLPPLTPECVNRTTAPCPRGVYGNVGRNTLIGPGLFTFDFNLLKNTKIKEGMELQFRAEFFNLLNRANFRLPNSSIFSAVNRRNAAAGQITATSTSARQIQFALKLIF
ncbi:MAG: hypothetical protein HY649_02930, partial [Acidobacteria bacterium]|nr:hypothetical protein [Acidobacteriota bacterium]